MYLYVMNLCKIWVLLSDKNIELLHNIQFFRCTFDILPCAITHQTLTVYLNKPCYVKVCK